MNYTIRNISALLILISIVTGCVSIQPFPNAAKSGETITLAVGSPEGMTKDNITVTFTSNDQVTYPGSTDITSGVKSVLKLYPD
ncbi:MAG: hypothetical protein KAR30_01880, partial [Gammaproteobacteria bacterium]|nr:hypothetical protein [Gammaproteobacteria bacterium]